MKDVLAFSGSLRSKSTNLTIINSISEMFRNRINVKIYEGLAELPHFNPDLDTDSPPAAVADLRRQLRETNAVIICTPEYVFSIPAALKNALEWTVSSNDFSAKPTALITASSLGGKTHESLFQVLKTIEADIDERTALLISGARTKINADGNWTDPTALDALKVLIEALVTKTKK